MDSSSQMIFTWLVVAIITLGIVIPMFFFVSYAERNAKELVEQMKKEREHKAESKKRGKK